jgi:hypothetical protein
MNLEVLSTAITNAGILHKQSYEATAGSEDLSFGSPKF